MGNVCIAIACFPSCVIINLKINLIFVIKSFFYMTKKSRHNFKYLWSEKSFKVETKAIFHHFEGLSVAKTCLMLSDIASSFTQKDLSIRKLLSVPFSKCLKKTLKYYTAQILNQIPGKYLDIKHFCICSTE